MGGIKLSCDNFLQLWVPAGFAHGFLALSEVAEIEYKVTNYWSKKHERSLIWNDPVIKINWPDLNLDPICSDKDNLAKKFSQLNENELF